MTDKQPEALRLAELLELAPEDGVEPQTAEDAAAELRRLHTENTALQQGYAAARLEIESLQARIKTMAEEHADELMVAHLDGRMRAAQPAGAQQPGVATWTPLPGTLPEPGKPVLLDIGMEYPIRAMWAAKHTLEVGMEDDSGFGEYDEATDTYYCPEGWYEWNEHEETHWAVDETPTAWCELPPNGGASHGQAPAQAAHSSAAQTANCTYPTCQIASGCGGACGRQLAQAAPAAVAEPVVNRATVIEWLDANDIEVTDRQMDGLFHSAAPAQPAPAYKDSTPELHVGDSAFESWYSAYSPAHKGDKQRARDAYAAGMGDPLATAAPQQEDQEPVAWYVTGCGRLLDEDEAKAEARHIGGTARAMPLYTVPQPCPTCIALARTVMLDQVSFDRKPDCYGIRQITDDEGVEEWEDIRTSPDVAREEANDMMATGRGEIYEVVPLWTTPQPTKAQAGANVKTVHQFRKNHCADWYDGFADHSDGGGPYEERTLYTVGAVPLDEARRLFDAGWKAAALFCDREDVVADGIIGFGACPQFEAAFSAANGIKGGQHGAE